MKYGQSEDPKEWFEHDLVGVLIITFLYMAYAVGVTPKINIALTGFFAAPPTPEATEAAA